MVATYEELSAELTKENPVITIKMNVLRDINKSGRLGPYVVDAISNELKSRGLSHYPPELPQSQHTDVRLYRQGTPVAEMYALVDDYSEEANEKLRQLGASDAAEKLKQIRQIIC